MWRVWFSSLFLALLLPCFAGAQEVNQDLREYIKAEVIEVVDERERAITGTGASTTVQEVRVQLKEGERAGEVVRFENDTVTLAAGDDIFVYRLVTQNGQEIITYGDFERRPVLVFIFLMFVGLLLVLSGWQAVRALTSLGVSIAAILFLLVPALLAGYSPVLVSVIIAGGILGAVLFGTHGINPRSLIAFGGTFGAVTITGLIAYVATDMMRLTGFASDASVYLNFATNGALDLSGLLLGSIIIGILGVLDDVSITQASVVQQLKGANPSFGMKELYMRAIKVGKDHIGSLVNTLALAYVAISLPLIMLYAKSDSSWWQTLNQEVVASEIIRIIIGSIGLVLAVPLTTLVAAWYWNEREVDENDDVGHHHHH